MQKQCCSQYIVWISLPANVKVFRAHDSGVFLPPATKLGQGNIFRSVCQQFCPQGGAACVVALGGMHGFIQGGVHGFIQGGVHGFIRGACMVLFGGACVVLFSGGHAWFYSAGGGARAWFFHFFRIQWDTVNERAVRILLECILVKDYFILLIPYANFCKACSAN